MDEWDQETLEKVVESKKNEYNQNKPTDIVSCFSYFVYLRLFIVCLSGMLVEGFLFHNTCLSVALLLLMHCAKVWTGLCSNIQPIMWSDALVSVAFARFAVIKL